MVSVRDRESADKTSAARVLVVDLPGHIRLRHPDSPEFDGRRYCTRREDVERDARSVDGLDLIEENAKERAQLGKLFAGLDEIVVRDPCRDGPNGGIGSQDFGDAA